MSSSTRTAFILQIHKNPEQVNKFISQLIVHDKADVYVHIDQKSAAALKGKIVTGPNVTILDKSVDCVWGDISQVDTTLLLMKAVLASKKQYDFICLRSGQDLLVKEGLEDFLQENKEKAFLTIRKMDRSELGLMRINWPKVMRKRYTTAHPIRIYRRLLLSLYRRGINLFPNLRKWPKEYSFYKGSQWFTIPLDVAKYMMEFLNDNKWYYRYFNNTLVPDESFFHTLIMNSPYRANVINNNLFLLKWGETLSDRNSPQDLTMEDLPLIENSDQFFARKFDETIDGSIVQYFSQKVRFGRTQSIEEKGVSLLKA